MKPYVIALTGASGAVYGVRLVEVMTNMGYDLALIISESAQTVLQEELGVRIDHWNQIEKLVPVFGKRISDHIQIFGCDDLLAPVASGSFPVEAMVIIPCSMATLGCVASGAGRNLIHRSADCVLKEGRKLVLVPRETPLNAIHLENMLKLSRLGVRMVPAMPAFYSGVATVQGMVDFVVGKVLDQLEIAHTLYPRWIGSLQKAGL